jgi:RNA polymerase sigma-70 factor (sigma-E family)
MVDDRDEEFRDVFDRLYPLARAIAQRVTRDRDRAEEIAAEALTRLFVRWAWLARRPHRDAWVLRVTTNLAIDAVRRQARRPVPNSDAPPSDPVVLIADRMELAGALRRLPRRQREVVALRYLADMSEQQVAELLGVSGGSVKTHLHRGLSALRKTLTTAGDDWEVGHADG